MREFVTRLFSDPATVRKFVVAFVGAVAIAISEGLLPNTWSGWVTVISGFLTSLGVYGIPNKDDSPELLSRNNQIQSRINLERGAVSVIEVLVIVLIIVLILLLVGVL